MEGGREERGDGGRGGDRENIGEGKWWRWRERWRGKKKRRWRW